MLSNEQLKLFRAFVCYHWLRPEVALLKYYQAVQWRKWEFKEPSMDLLCGDGEFAFLTWGGEFDIMSDMYVNIPRMTMDDYFSNRDVYDVPFRKKTYKRIKNAEIKITTGFDNSSGQINKAKKLDLYREFILGDVNLGLEVFDDNKYSSVFTNSINVAENLQFLLSEIRRILKKHGRLFLSLQARSQVELALYNLYKKKKLKLGKYLDRGIYDNLVDSTFEIKDFLNRVKECGFKIISKEKYGHEILFRIYQIGFRPMFPAFIEMYHSLSKMKFEAVKNKWIENLVFLSEELLDTTSAKKLGKECFWYFLVLEK